MAIRWKLPFDFSTIAGSSASLALVALTINSKLEWMLLNSNMLPLKRRMGLSR
jgi:hypothetical protein